MPESDRYTDSILIVYPQDRFASQAIERFEDHGVSFEMIRPPEHLRDVACPAIRLPRNAYGAAQEISQKEKLFHIGIVDWRPAAPGADRIERLVPGSGPAFLETLQITFIAPCMAERARPQPLEIYKRLPGTNCRECGEPTCMAFAARLARGEAALGECPHIYLAEYEEKRMALLTLFPGLEAEEGSAAPT